MKKVIIIILDGYGYSPKLSFNAIKNADTPFIDKLKKIYPNTLIHTSGQHVGLPIGQMGNSEVGHITLGAGRIVYQDSSRIDKSISDKSFFKNQVLSDAIHHAKKTNKQIHFMGLLSDGGIHSHQNHLYALLKMAKHMNIENVHIHAFLDGRDTAPKSALHYIDKLEEQIESIGIGKISTVSGRYFAMDRDKRWERIELAYQALVGRGKVHFDSAKDGIEFYYKKNVTDEFIEPFFVENATFIKEKDTIIFFNFRADRARELTEAFSNKNFTEFKQKIFDPYFVQFTRYHSDSPFPVAFEKEKITNTLAELLSKKGLKQFRCAETEKYAHITFFFNGGNEAIFQGESRLLIPSPNVRTYDLKPEMSAYKVTHQVKKAIILERYDFIAVNYANSDMVGHTGNYKAAIRAIETLDLCLSRVVPCAQEHNYEVIITADHGNSEQMIDYKTKETFTQHTISPVPMIYVGKCVGSLQKNGSLKDIAPSILDLMELEQPKEMTGKTLLNHIPK